MMTSLDCFRIARPAGVVPPGTALLLCGVLGAAAGLAAFAEPPPTVESQKTLQCFSIAVQDGVSWLATPEGQRFFSRGVCVVTPGQSRDDENVENPTCAAWHHYADTNA